MFFLSVTPQFPIQATGEQHGKTNELCEFDLTIHETDCPTCSSGEERGESLSSRWPQKRTLSVSLSKKLPFLFTAVSHTVTRGLAGTDEQVRVPKGRTENEQTDCSKEERRQKVRERERRGSGGTRNEMRGLGQAAGESEILIDESSDPPGIMSASPTSYHKRPTRLISSYGFKWAKNKRMKIV
ncbi:hypothetical protein M9H77_34177 [Catharanthus roseus]|uniref:Uncharacterized protein n=1 Tax=Catharanthus roseus TaxID=4058 RepID=A0ACB9ZKH3_CATRO|nr:hypothetical protein M9H77_34177 [Catharanthus roseus]